MHCATALEICCARCNAEVPAGARFCAQRASPVDLLPTAAAPSRSPVAYTPRHLADKILKSKTALEGERKRVTVLFADADVKGAMELVGQLGPEPWHRPLDQFFLPNKGTGVA